MAYKYFIGISCEIAQPKSWGCL